MARLGEALRAERERMGLTLEQAAEDTRIREKFLRALENGDYQTLPGAVYTKGFLRNYAEYLNLDPDALILQFQTERGTPDAPRSFEPMRPIMRRAVILTPAVLVPVVVLAAVALFLGYLYYQFTTFAVLPRLEITEPAGDAIVQVASYDLRGRTVPDGRITIRILPGGDTIPDLRASADGSFGARVPLKPGANHVEIQVLDATGKINQASRTIRFESAAAAPSPSAGAVRLEIASPANGATITNELVTVTGQVPNVPGGTTITVNGVIAQTFPDGRFVTSLALPAGSQAIRIVARNSSGENAQTRTVNVAYTATFVVLRVQGGEAWIQVFVDGTQATSREGFATGRVFVPGQQLTFAGRQILVRTGNGGATFIVFNGQELGALGTDGQVVERSFNQ